MEKPGIRFKDYLIPLIKEGSKRLTYRKGAKYAMLEVGDLTTYINGATNEVEGNIEITEKYYTTFKELPFDCDGHEKYKSKEHQREVFESYYGEMKDNEKILVLGFKVHDQ